MSRQAADPRSTLIRRLSLVLKLAVSAALIVFVVDRVDVLAILEIGRRFDLMTAGFVLVLLTVQIPVLANRWRLVAARLGVQIGTTDAIRVTWIGIFFNNFLPGAMGGDLVRAFLLRKFGAGWSDALISVAVDRLTALVTLLGLIAAGLPFILLWPMAETVKIGIAMVFGLSLAALFGLSLVALVPASVRVRFPRIALPSVLVRRAFSAMLPVPVFISLLTSGLLVHGLTISIVFAISSGLGVQTSFLDILIVVPVVILILAVPISLAGWGLREGAMIVLLGARGVTEVEAVAISVGWGIAFLASGLPGIFFWLASRR